MTSLPVTLTLTPVDTKGAPTGKPARIKIEGYDIYTIGKADSMDITLPGDYISGSHAVLNVTAEGIGLRDDNSTNGTRLNGNVITAAQGWVRVESGDTIQLPGFHLAVQAQAAQPAAGGGAAAPVKEITQVDLDSFKDRGHSADPDVARVLGHEKVIDINAINSADIPFERTKFCAVGGGLGSFTWVDHLRVYGIPADQIRVLGTDPICYGTYKRYCRNSQIPDHERLRSNSQSTPDNIWGFPGYASREAIGGLARGRFGGFKYIFQVFGEPALAESYTPRAGHVFDSLDREAERINWKGMFVQSQALALRKTMDGRYVILYKLRSGQMPEGQRLRLLVADVVHLSTGYPATRFVDDVQEFRAKHATKQDLVRNAYEPHDELYTAAEQSGEDEFFVVRGRGIVASRIIQRLHEARVKNPRITILQSVRSRLMPKDGAEYGRTKRLVRGNVEIQPFNWPKSCWGGDLRFEYENAGDEKRGYMLNVLGGTTTAERTDWQDIIERGTEQGWYRPVYGNIVAMEPGTENGSDKIDITVQTPEGHQEKLKADHLIDCTGLIADVDKSTFLGDLLHVYGLEQNHAYAVRDGKPVKGRKTGLKTSNHFEVEGLRNANGRVYGSGTIVQGGAYLAVDSFLGLQYTALRSVDNMVTERLHGVRNLHPLKSFGGWFKWAINAKI